MPVDTRAIVARGWAGLCVLIALAGCGSAVRSAGLGPQQEKRLIGRLDGVRSAVAAGRPALAQARLGGLHRQVAALVARRVLTAGQATVLLDEIHQARSAIAAAAPARGASPTLSPSARSTGPTTTGPSGPTAAEPPAPASGPGASPGPENGQDNGKGNDNGNGNGNGGDGNGGGGGGGGGGD